MSALLVVIAVALLAAMALAPGHCGRVALRKNRPVSAWKAFGFFAPFLALPLVHVVPALELKCPACGTLFRTGQKRCSGCGEPLPHQHVELDADRPLDARCPSCRTPYRSADYLRSAAVWPCDRCGANLRSS